MFQVGRERYCEDAAQSDISMIDVFGCRIVYIDYSRTIMKIVEAKLDRKAGCTIILQ